MKCFFTAILLLSVCFATAQIVNFPNTDLKNEILGYGTIDTNGDGEIQISEAQAVHNLSLQHGITDDLAWLQYFSNVDTLWLYSWPPLLTNLNLPGMTSLRRFACDSKNLQTVNLSGCSNLIHAEINYYTPYPYAPITSLDISNTPRLRDLQCSGLHVAELDLRQKDSLVNLQIWEGSEIGVINISGLTMCEKVTAAGHTGFINAENATALTFIQASSGSSHELHLIDSLNVHGCTNLRQLSLGENYLGSTVNVSTCPNLLYIGGVCNTLNSLDLGNNSNLNTVAGKYQNLRYLNLKNGRKQYPYLDFGGDLNQRLYICTDDNGETEYLDSILSLRGWPDNTLIINPFCSSNAIGGAYNTITGTIKRDADHNGCDNADPVMIHVPVKVTNASGISVMKYTGDPSGMYRYYDTTGNFTIRPYFPYPYYSVSPTSASVAFTSVNNITAANDFCISSTGFHNKLDITVIPTRPAVPGYYAGYKIYYRNTGTTNLSGNVQFNFDNNKMNYFSASIPPVQSTGQFTWDYTNLQPFETRSISVVFQLFPPPANNMGDTLIVLATINPVSGDETPWDNHFILPQKCTSPFDPNDKECLQGEKLDIAKIGEPLDYVIRFQNLGTAPATNVVVTDTLSNNLDWESFDITGTSHPCDIQRKDNKLQFYFKDINLPEAAVDEPGSHGFVAFKIRPKNTIAIGDSLNNRASIYFDFNAPVVTNMATTIVSPTSSVAVKLEYFSLTSKNETNLLTWKAPSTTGTTNFGVERSNDGIHFSNFGNITASVDRCQLPFNFTDEKPFDGKTYYRLNIKDADGNSFYSKVLVAGRTKSGLSINAIVSDRNNTTIYLDASKEQNVQIKIIAADGRLMYNQNKTIAAGNNTLNLQLKNLATGIYTLIVYTREGEVITKRFVK
ncbi:MAG: T9SS type A sorting domain-containing protein [Ferruginibacter sp.]